VGSSAAFEFATEALERETDFDRLQARGTVRLTLRQAGIDAGSVTPAEMAAVIERDLPGQLEARGVEQAHALCRRLQAELLGLEQTAGAAEGVPSRAPNDDARKPR
jgi:hypothetical protein